MMKTLTEKRFFEWYEDDVAVTLRNHSGSYGGGSEVLVICFNEKFASDGYAHQQERTPSISHAH